ncbi:MAG: DUF421 domain-containing protein [Bacilli bacterium]|nr:DUF421 domain-containing protein [Bacilli bacterium]
MSVFLVVIFRTVIFYSLIVILYRLMGKREIGQLGIVDLIVSISMAQLASISIENYKDPLLIALIPVLLLAIFQISFAFCSLKYHKFRNIFEGKPSVIIERGKVNFKAMVKEKYNLDDLLTQLREQGIKSLEEVEYAILETNGNLSVFKYNLFKIPSNLPLPLVLDGVIQTDTLNILKKDEYWLNEMLDKENLILNEIFYAFYKGKKIYVIKKQL